MNDKDIMSQEDSLPDLRYNRFYKVPKSLNPSFYDIGISSNICLAIASIEIVDEIGQE